MKDRTILVSALVACGIHALILLLNFGMTPPILASSPAAIEVSLVAPPEPEPPPAAEPVAPLQPPEIVEPISIPEPEPIVESAVEPVPTPDSEPIVEPAVEPAPTSDSEPEPPMDIQEIPPIETEQVQSPGAEISDIVQTEQPIADFAGAAEPVGPAEAVEPTLDHAPSYLSNPKPRYPREARRNGQQGTVMLMVEVLEDGRPGEISIENSSGHKLLDEAAIKGVRRWRFVPAKKGNHAVRARVRIPVEFNLRDKR